jgi:hypothetical protein
MNINLQIERLILEGIDFSPRQRRQLQAVVESELSRLFTEKGIPPNWQKGGNIPQLPINLTATTPQNPNQIGQQIAQTIYEGINP